MSAGKSIPSDFGAPRLNGHNYTTWKKDMKSFLQTKKVWRVVDGTKPRPTTITDANGAVTNQDAIDEWDDKNEDACGTIFRCIDDSQRIHVTTQDVAHTIWT